ncbi:MAG: RimK domain-containing protein ATP-grasp [Verrucomicrobiota bacterium]
MILIWGIPGDLSAETVRTALVDKGADVWFLDQTAALQTEISLSIGELGCRSSLLNGVLRCGGDSLPLSQVTAVYIRAMDFRLLPALAQLRHDSPEWAHAAALEDLLVAWMEMTSARVVNRPSAMGPNNSKPFQAAQLRELGFITPRTLITTDPDAARQFLRHHREVIYKSISSVRSIVTRLRADDPTAYERLADVANCPTQFQEYIAGEEYRIHTVGKQVFASRIISDADDYRHPERSNTQTQIVPAEVPSGLGALCSRAAHALDLAIAGFDLRRGPDGTWYCFEVNPAPGYGHYQLLTGQPMGAALADLLMDGDATFGPCAQPLTALASAHSGRLTL